MSQLCPRTPWRRATSCNLLKALFLSALGSFAAILGSCGTTSNITGPAITSQPVSQIVLVGQSASFRIHASGPNPITYQWRLNGTDIPGATGDNYTIPVTASSDNGSVFQVVVSDASGSLTSRAATLTVTLIPGAATPVSVLTYHNDVARTGQNLNETALTPSNVNASTFGKIGFLTVQGKVEAQPLYMPNLTIGGVAHNVIFVATEHDLVYAFDADNYAILWQASLLGSGESPSDDRGCEDYSPEIGVLSTPVIDPAAGADGVMFVVAMSMDVSKNYYQRLHALNLTTGAEQGVSPATIQATYPNLSGQITFDPKQYSERAALLLLNGVVYTAWSSHCDKTPYTSWLMGYDESTLQQTTVLNLTPNGSEGAIWMAGGGMAADPSGFIYLINGNGTFDTSLDAKGFPSMRDFGNAFVRLSTSGGTLGVADYFSMHNTTNESNADQDIGSGGILLLPDVTDSLGKTLHLAVGAGKDSCIYVVNRDSMGHFLTNDDAVYQEIDGVLDGGVFSTPSYFHGTVYYGAVKDSLQAFPIQDGKLSAATSSSVNRFGFPGTTPSVSANDTFNGIVWAVENGSTGILHAYDANNLGTELYNSNQASGNRDHFAGDKFIVPTISNGKVYVGTPTGVAVFGLLH